MIQHPKRKTMSELEFEIHSALLGYYYEGRREQIFESVDDMLEGLKDTVFADVAQAVYYEDEAMGKLRHGTGYINTGGRK